MGGFLLFSKFKIWYNWKLAFYHENESSSINNTLVLIRARFTHFLVLNWFGSVCWSSLEEESSRIIELSHFRTFWLVTLIFESFLRNLFNKPLELTFDSTFGEFTNDSFTATFFRAVLYKFILLVGVELCISCRGDDWKIDFLLDLFEIGVKL